MTLHLLSRLPQLIGIDLSYAKLSALATKVPRMVSRAIQADALTLPFPRGSFDTVIAIHVLHLISNRRQALAEFRRVLASHGLYLRHSIQLEGSSIHNWMRTTVAELVGKQSRPHRARRLPDLDPLLVELGDLCSTILIGKETYSTTPAAEILKIRDRIKLGTWCVHPSRQESILSQLGNAAVEHFGSLTQTHSYTERFELQYWRFRETQDE